MDSDEKTKSSVDKLGLTDEKTKEYLKNHPEEAEKLFKSLFEDDKKRAKSESASEGFKALNERYYNITDHFSIYSGFFEHQTLEEFSFNKTFVAITVTIVMLILVGIIVYFNMFYYK